MTFEEAAADIPAGVYRHFKGNYYRVIAIARHSESLEPVVVYRALYGDGGIWVRPAEMWTETVEREGRTCRRFQLLSPEERVAFYEQIYDELVAVSGGFSEEQQRKLLLLDEYYTSGEWRTDYEADEAGQLPAELKRGVLSQDGVYDLLSEQTR